MSVIKVFGLLLIGLTCTVCHKNHLTRQHMTKLIDRTEYVDFSNHKRRSSTSATTQRMDSSPPALKQGFLQIEKPLANFSKEPGENVRFRCEVSGDPNPNKFLWYKNDAPVIEEKGRVIIKDYRNSAIYGSRLRINDLEIHDTGYYKCEVSNGLETIESTSILVVRLGKLRGSEPQSTFDWPERHSPVFTNYPSLSGSIFTGENQPGFCQVYRGRTCSLYLGSSPIHVTSKKSQELIEERLRRAFEVIGSSEGHTKNCTDFALPAVCYHAFPFCEEGTGLPRPRQICKDDCLLLQNELCKVEYHLAQSHPVIGPQLVLPKCDDLPSIGSKESENCLRLGIHQQKQIVADEDLNWYMSILMPSLAVIATLTLLTGIWFRRRRQKGSRPDVISRDQPHQELELNSLQGAIEVKSFPLINIRFLEELGECEFGILFKGEVLDSNAGNKKVVIKTLRENLKPQMQCDFEREIAVKGSWNHPNIACMLGVCLAGVPKCILFEIAIQKDLHEFLIQHSPRSYFISNSGHILSHNEQLLIAAQVASAMEYLSSQRYIHRDLAARNCFISDRLELKVTDFGFARDAYSSDYYEYQSRILPVRWLSPESLFYDRFTIDGNVWTFGIVLWEVFSFGLKPYYGLSNAEVIQLLRTKQLLPRPQFCTAEVYTLMVECWCDVAVLRPSFQSLHQRLRHWLENARNDSRRASADNYSRYHRNSDASNYGGSSSNDGNASQKTPTRASKNDQHSVSSKVNYMFNVYADPLTVRECDI